MSAYQVSKGIKKLNPIIREDEDTVICIQTNLNSHLKGFQGRSAVKAAEARLICNSKFFSSEQVTFSLDR